MNVSVSSSSLPRDPQAWVAGPQPLQLRAPLPKAATVKAPEPFAVRTQSPLSIAAVVEGRSLSRYLLHQRALRSLPRVRAAGMLTQALPSFPVLLREWLNLDPTTERL